MDKTFEHLDKSDGKDDNKVSLNAIKKTAKSEGYSVVDKKKSVAKKMSHPISSTKGGRHKFVDSKTKKEYSGGIYGGMNIENAMDFEKHRKLRNG